MKKVLFLMAIGLLPAISFAQFSVGIKGGVNLSRFSLGKDVVAGRLNANGSPSIDVNGRQILDNLGDSFNSRTGTSFGIYTRIGSNLFLQPELLYSTRSSEFTIQRPNVSGPEVVTLQTTSLDVPILLGLKGGPLRVMAGPIISFQVDNNQGVQDALRQYTTGSLNDAWSKAYYGFQVGGGLDLGRLGIDVRYETSLSDVVSVELAGSSAAFNQKLRSWQATLAYRIF